VRKRLIWTAVSLITVYAASLLLTGILARQAEASTPRNEDTGIMIGAEPFTLGDEDADVAVLFIHGFVGGTDNFADVPQRVADLGVFVDAMLLPGHGTRARDLKNVPADELLDAVLVKVRELKSSHKRVILVSHSMGGALSTLAASQEEVDGLVLGAPYFGVTHKWYYGFRPETWAKVTAPIIPWVFKGQLFLQCNDKSQKKNITSYRWIPSKANVALGKLGKQVNAPGVLEAIECPVLMFHAKGDVAASPDAAEHALNTMASEDKELVWLPRSNHHIYWDYDREMVAAGTVEFVKAIRDRP
jgi:carboxylesterase